MSAYSVSPHALQSEDGSCHCAITRWEDGKPTIVAWTEGKTSEDALSIGAAIVLALNTAVAEVSALTEAAYNPKCNTDPQTCPVPICFDKCAFPNKPKP